MDDDDLVLYDAGESYEPTDPADCPVDGFSWGEVTYSFGEIVRKIVPDDEQGTKTKVLGSAIWPIEIVEHIESGQSGVRLLYRTRSGSLQTTICPAEGFASGSEARRVAAELSGQGVQIGTDQGKACVYAIGRWTEAAADEIPSARVCSSPGWVEGGEVYVAGQIALGSGLYRADPRSVALQRRATSIGTLWEQCDWIDRHVTTPGLRAAVGAALAGPLVGWVHPQNFVLHFWGDSGCGKTTAAEIAASIWADPTGGYWQTWDTTVNAIEASAEMADGACLVLDELTKWDDGPRSLSKAIYNLGSRQGRARLKSSGQMRRQRSWQITAVSTGEVSVTDRIGRYKKGGHDSRIHDVHVSVDGGGLTESKAHADAIKSACGAAGGAGHAGHVGTAYIDYLIGEVQPHRVRDVRDRLADRLMGDYSDGSSEADRILLNVALIGAAQILAGEAPQPGCPDQSLIGWSEAEAVESCRWLADKIIGGRSAHTPNERAMQLLWKKIDTHPYHYPTPSQLSDGAVSSEVWGVRDESSTATGGTRPDQAVYLSKSSLDASGVPEQAGVSARSFLRWATDTYPDRCREIGRKRLGGIRRRWYRIDALPDDLED